MSKLYRTLRDKNATNAGVIKNNKNYLRGKNTASAAATAAAAGAVFYQFLFFRNVYLLRPFFLDSYNASSASLI